MDKDQDGYISLKEFIIEFTYNDYQIEEFPI